MKHQGKAWLAASVLALVAAGCSFDDPAGGLRNGPQRITLTKTAITIRDGDSLDVQAFLLDDQGNQLPVSDAQWSSADPAIADVHIDAARPAPGGTFSRAFVLGLTNQAGVTTVTVTAQGVSNQVRVTVLPATFPGVRTITGTAGADTVTVNRPAPNPPLVVTYTAGDTLVLTATATVTFNATTAGVNFGPFPGYIVSRSANTIKAVSRQAFAGKATVTNLVYAGDASTGPIAIASLQTDSFQIQHGRFRGGITISTSAFGPNTQMKVTPATGTTFTAATSVIFVGSTQVIALQTTADSIIAILPGTVTAGIMVTNVKQGTLTYDSLRTAANNTVNASFFPGTVANGAGNLLDTIKVYGGGTATFKAGAAGACTASSSLLRVGGSPAFMLRCTTDSLYAIAKLGSAAAASIDSVIVAGVTIPSLQTQAAVNVSNATTGEANEPGNNNPSTVVIAPGTTAAPLVFYGAISSSGDVDDFFSFTTTVATTLTLRLDFAGTAPSAGSATNPDVDMVVCKGTCASPFGADNVGGFGAATAANPENLVVALAAATTYNIYLNGYGTGSNNVTYKLTVSKNP